MPSETPALRRATIEVVLIGGIQNRRDPRLFVGKGAKFRDRGYGFIVSLGANQRFRAAQGCVNPRALRRDRTLQSQALIEMAVDLQSVIV
jgi:hypothetical protein